MVINIPMLLNFVDLSTISCPMLQIGPTRLFVILLQPAYILFLTCSSTAHFSFFRNFQFFFETAICFSKWLNKNQLDFVQPFSLFKLRVIYFNLRAVSFSVEEFFHEQFLKRKIYGTIKYLMVLFVKIVNGKKPLTIFLKNSIITYN